MTDIVTLLNAVSANVTGPAINTGRVEDELTLQVFTTGTVSAFSVQLQGSLDGVQWQNIGSAVTSATAGTNLSTGALYQYFQAILSGYSGTGSVTCELAYNLGLVVTPAGGSPPSGSAGGDLSGTYPNPSVAKVGGTAFSLPVSLGNGGTGQATAAAAITALTGTQSAGKVLRSDGTNATLSAIQVTDLPIGTEPGDVNLLWWTFDPAASSASVGVLTTAGTVYLTEFFNRTVQTLSGLLYHVGTQGSVLTSGQCFAGIYDSTGTLRAATADQSANFGGTGVKTAAFTSAYTSAPAGRYYVGFFFNGTTGPSLKGSGAPPSLYNVNLTGANLRCAAASSTGNTTAMPPSITLSGNSGTNALPIWAGGT